MIFMTPNLMPKSVPKSPCGVKALPSTIQCLRISMRAATTRTRTAKKKRALSPPLLLQREEVLSKRAHGILVCVRRHASRRLQGHRRAHFHRGEHHPCLLQSSLGLHGGPGEQAPAAEAVPILPTPGWVVVHVCELAAVVRLLFEAGRETQLFAEKRLRHLVDIVCHLQLQVFAVH